MVQVKNVTPFELALPAPMPAAGPILDAQDAYLEKLLLEPLFQPGAILEEDGKPLEKDAVKSSIYATFGSHIQVSAEEPLKELYAKALLYYKPELAFKDILLVQSAVKENLPAPSPTIIYTPGTDVIPVSKQFLAGQCSFGMWFATFGYYLRADILGVAMKDGTAFARFKEFLAKKTAAMKGALPAQTEKRLNDLQQETLDSMNLGLVLRTANDPETGDLSFARVVQEWAQEFAANDPDTYMCPFSLPELLLPNSILFLNIDAHAHASEKEVFTERMDIQRAVKNPPVVLSKRRLDKLGKQAAELERLARKKHFSTQKDIARAAARRKFLRRRPSYIEVYQQVMKILKKLGQVQKSQNPYAFQKPSYARASRRDPDNYNMKGKQTRHKYYPDIHLYIDTSGSITEAMFADAVKAAIVLGKKLGINVYVNFFSTVLSQPYVLHLNGRSVQQAYKEFQTFSRPTGGTDFEEVWKYIQISKTRRRELSLMITDFGYDAPSTWCSHPKNLYYMPCTQSDWETICLWAQEFVNSAVHIDPAMRNRLLF